MRILILNWRDIKNPKSGGAEILTHEIAKRWVLWGHTVVQISAKFENGKSKETIDGVKLIRLGRWWSVHFLAFLYYFKNLQSNTDVIIDEVHGLPFFSALYAPRKTVLFACEVADQLFFQIFPYPIALVGIVLEKLYLNFYRNIPSLAISKSTQEDLIKRGFKKKNVTVLPMGLTIPKGIKKYSKEKNPTLIYLSRINKQKGIEDAIEIFSLIHKELPKSRLWIVGSGSPKYIKDLRGQIKKYGFLRSVKFFGFVDEKRKFELLSRSHFLIFPSVHEGWGLVISEAGIVGTPSAVYDVPGVRDVVRHGKRGIMVEKSRPDLLAEHIIFVLRNDKLYKDLQGKLVTFKKETSWDNTAKKAFSAIRRL